MQQTEKYKLNLIEPSDPFLPDALNANTQRLEDVLIDRMEGSLDAMSQRVAALESVKHAYGSSDAATSETDRSFYIRTGFQTRMVLLSGAGTAFYTDLDPYRSTVQFLSDGFTVEKNASFSSFRYLAFG